MATCLNCNRSEMEVPLVVLQYQGQPHTICSQCFPLLIHSPAKLAGKIKDAETLKPAVHDDHE